MDNLKQSGSSLIILLYSSQIPWGSLNNHRETSVISANRGLNVLQQERK